MKNKFIKNILLAAASSIFTIVFIITGINLYLRYIHYGGEVEEHDWTVIYGTYDERYVFWQSCFNGDTGCWKQFRPIDEMVLDSTKITRTGSENELCMKVLFLGDSYSSRPFSEKSYGDFFIENLSNSLNSCVEGIYLSSGGVGTSQELAMLEDKIDEIQPHAVVWQFYWNDFFENVKFSLHDIESGKLVRKNAWENSAFWAGYLNQNIPFLIDSTLGHYISNKLMHADIFRSWSVNPFGDDLYGYNEEFISLALKDVKEMGKEKKFSLFTTASPLECLIVERYDCENWTIKQHNALIGVLKENSNYLSMTEYDKNSEVVLGEVSDKGDLFSDLDPAYKGIRHLSNEGEKYFGSILFENFKSQVIEKN